MILSREWLFAPIILSVLGLALLACNSTDSERFNAQKESYIFDTTSTTLTAFGASRTDDDPDNSFRCPNVSGMSGETSLTVFNARANALLPHFTIKSVAGIRGDAAGGIGISLSELPVGLLDIYQRCNSTTSEKYVTSCPPEYDIVDECGDSNQKECMQVFEGTHQLVISSTINDDSFCITEESDRYPYATSVPNISYACDAFDPIPVTAAYRGSAPINSCCAPNDQSTLDFCIKPCGCRELSIRIVPKQLSLEPLPDHPDSPVLPDELKIAVFSNVEGNKDAFRELLKSIRENAVDMIVNLGNLTESGKTSQFSAMYDIVREELYEFDGTLESGCELNDDLVCCETESSRAFTHTCNAILGKIPFLTSLGEDEYEGTGINKFQTLFGPSNTSTTIGKVQLIMLDTADASMSSAERSWLKSVLYSPEHSKCKIPAPQQFDAWPSLNECRTLLGASSKNITCRECIQTEAYCIPPDADHSYYMLGPENCICVPATSQICPNNQTCEAMNGQESSCICTRDNDCGDGGTCVEGKCIPPIRLLFSYTPLFDDYGTRNNAFASKAEAASLLSLMIKSGVNAIFSGRARDYSKYSMGGIPMYITGGGSKMSSFSSHKRHWLLIRIPNAYTTPDADKISVNVIEF